MTFGIDHINLRVTDLQASSEWYQRHFDYEPTPTGSNETVFLEPPAHRVGLAGIELVETEDDGAIDVGDAWGHIALRVTDLEAAYEGLMDAGVPDYRDPESCGGHYAFVKDPDGHEIELVTREDADQWTLDHVMMRVEDADRAIGYWARKFGYESVGRWEADTFANYFLRPSDVPDSSAVVELTYNYDGRSYELGNGWGHLGLAVDDLEDAVATLDTREAPTEDAPDSLPGTRAATDDPEGHGIQLIERP